MPVKKVKGFLALHGYGGDIHHTEDTIFTVEDASSAVGAPPEEILKSLIFMVDGDPMLVLMSGINKVDRKKVSLATGKAKSRIKMASPDYVLESFGFRVGGIPPVGYEPPLPALIDEEVFSFDIVWAAAGTDHDFFPIAPQDLKDYTDGLVADLKE